MNQKEENYSQPTDKATALIFDEDWSRLAAEIESEVGEISAGLDWGSARGYLMMNPGLFGRLTQLRVSLNREARLLLEEWNLGVARKSATACARKRILEKLINPSPELQEILANFLSRDELFCEEFIPDHQALRELLTHFLNADDWEAIANMAASSVHEQIIVLCNIKIATNSDLNPQVLRS